MQCIQHARRHGLPAYDTKDGAGSAEDPRDFGTSDTEQGSDLTMSTAAPRVRVLRGVEPQAADLGAIRTHRARQLVVDPALVQAATDDGYRAGYQAGFDAGLADAAEAINAREASRASDLNATLQRLEQATALIREDHDEIILSVEHHVMRIAAELAAIIVGRELSTTEHPGLEALQRALQFAPRGAAATAYLHPDDMLTLGDYRTAFDRDLEVVEDPTLQRGDCVLDIDAMRIDSRIADALQRVRDAVNQ